MRPVGQAIAVVAVALPLLSACTLSDPDPAVAEACLAAVREGLPRVAEHRIDRFLGKVDADRARCRGGAAAVAHGKAPEVDWANYWAAGGAASTSPDAARDRRGIAGALLDLELQRMELIAFNLFDNATFETYLKGRPPPGPRDGAAVTVWPEMRLPPDRARAAAVTVEPDGSQLCTGAAIRFRSRDGICNDIRNPAMGSTGQLLGRNVPFEATFPEQHRDAVTKNRHEGRIGLLRPDPRTISRQLFSRGKAGEDDCNDGRGDGSAAACPYRKAPFLNVLAAFWIQFMNHDWFSHLDEGRNDPHRMQQALGIDAARVAQTAPPGSFRAGGRDRLRRAPETFRNYVTAWWDASQIYGYDERSAQRVRRDPNDPAKLLTVPVGDRPGTGETQGYLPLFRAPCGAGQVKDCDPIRPEWAGQEAAAFPDNWSIGLSFFHTLFVREHNFIVDRFRRLAAAHPDRDSGLRDPARPDRVIPYGALGDEELFQVARLIVAAEIAKIHTLEWTPQLLYDEPVYRAMQANWGGLFENHPLAAAATRRLIGRLAHAPGGRHANQLTAALAAGPGILGLGSHVYPTAVDRWLGIDRWSLADPDDVNGGTHHFGAPFNFTEEFVSVYRLHSMVPDLLEMRHLAGDPNAIVGKRAVVDTFRAGATRAMRQVGLADWALTMGRQRAGLLSLRNMPRFLQHLDLRPRLDTRLDVAALDVLRDRERGLPRFNEFRRQIGLRALTGFDDFIDPRLPAGSPQRAWQEETVRRLRAVYGRHRCDATKIITTVQRGADGRLLDDCLGHPDGSLVDNVEDLDIVVGFLAETVRPHGFAISETQFQVFILNASRRLFSDRFFTSSFRPEFYTTFGIRWVMDNGPSGPQWEAGRPNGHRQPVSPLKRVMLRAMPELAPQLKSVVNVFDPWARARGGYYALDWTPKPGAEDDPAFHDAAARPDGARP